jgi:hypothetical protein
MSSQKELDNMPNTYSLVVTFSDGQQATAAGVLTTVNHAAITSFSPTTIFANQAGQVLTVNGTNFPLGAGTLLVGATSVAINVASATSFTVTLPALA